MKNKPVEVRYYNKAGTVDNPRERLGHICELSFENKVKQSKNGLLLNTSELDDLARHFSQIIETLIIGDSDIEKLRRYNTIEDTTICIQTNVVLIY